MKKLEVGTLILKFWKLRKKKIKFKKILKKFKFLRKLKNSKNFKNLKILEIPKKFENLDFLKQNIFFKKYQKNWKFWAIIKI